MISERYYMARMLSASELKRLAWRAHHRGTKEADMLIGGFFDAHHHGWSGDERVQFEHMLAAARRNPKKHFAPFMDVMAGVLRS